MSRNLTEEHLNAIARQGRQIEYEIEYCMACITVCHFREDLRYMIPVYQQYIQVRRKRRKNIAESFAKMISDKKLKQIIHG